ncbi:hypothetical protein Y1Q_0005820 [Alligator mississippiensis]|uniref:Uncharacterized protein n=1 Tax=Alligator mississippiensis TaxID=8496 RepID=A0A151MG18_ALLMI|nr:hypothetical protein Y1Q_0005820 [Alligator mississippiensis]
MKDLVLCMLLSSIPQLCCIRGSCGHAEPGSSSSPARRLLPAAEVSTLMPALEQDACSDYQPWGDTRAQRRPLAGRCAPQKASPKPSSGRSWRRNYLEVDGAYENRAFEVECAIDTLSLDETPAPPSLEGPGPTAPTGAMQARPEGSQASVQSETSPQGRCPSPSGATSSAAAEDPHGRRPDGGADEAAVPTHVCTTLHLYRPETSACLPPGEQAGAVLAVTIDIRLRPAEVRSAAGAAPNASEPPLPEAASQPPAASLDPGPRSYL